LAEGECIEAFYVLKTTKKGEYNMLVDLYYRKELEILGEDAIYPRKSFLPDNEPKKVNNKHQRKVAKKSTKFVPERRQKTMDFRKVHADPLYRQNERDDQWQKRCRLWTQHAELDMHDAMEDMAMEEQEQRDREYLKYRGWENDEDEGANGYFGFMSLDEIWAEVERQKAMETYLDVAVFPADRAYEFLTSSFPIHELEALPFATLKRMAEDWEVAQDAALLILAALRPGWLDMLLEEEID
jgi:hypothetical protein